MEGKVIISREEYESSLGDFIEKEKLQKRIDKAIEYIEWLRNTHHKTENISYTKVVYNTNELLQILHILKGE